MSRDIDQEVSDTLCTLLSFDEDNFLSQEEVEENLRNCSYISNVSTLEEKCYEDYATTNSGNEGIDESTDGKGADIAEHECATDEEKEQTEMLQKVEDVSMDAAKNDKNPSHTHDDNECAVSLETTSTPLNSIVTNESPSNKQISEIKTEIACEPEQITEEQMPPPLSPKPPIESMQKDSAGDTSCKMSDGEIDIKLEFTCESEKINDEKLPNVYFNEDEFKKDINFNYGLTQIEIGCLIESGERDDEGLPNDLLLNESLLSQNSDQFMVANQEDVCDGEDNRELSNVMSDHNYTSQEKTPDKENLQKLLVNHILQSKGPSMSLKVVTDFVEKTLESISLFGIDNNIESGFNDVKAKDSIEKLDIFADGKSTKGAIFDEELSRLDAIEKAGDEILIDEKEKVLKVFEDQAEENDKTSQADMSITNISISSLASPLANCSEPMEHVLPDKSFKSDADSINIDGIEFKTLVDETDSTVSESSNATKTEMECNALTTNEVTAEAGIITETKSAHEAITTTEKKLAQEAITKIETKTAQEVITTPTPTTVQKDITTPTPETDQADITTETSKEDGTMTLDRTHSTEKFENDETKENTEINRDDPESAQIPTVQENVQSQLIVDEKPGKIAIFNKELGQMALKESVGICEDINMIEELPGDEEASTNITTADNNGFKAINITSIPSPAEYCSEPLEHTTFDEAFDLNCNEKVTVINHLDTLKSFAKALREDCETFTSSTTTIECKLQKYMQEKLEIFKKIVYSAVQIRCEDKSIQTDERLPKRKFRKLNQYNKKMLLQPMDSGTSTSDLSSSSDNEHSIKSQQKSRSRIKRTSNNNTQLDDDDDQATQINSEAKKKENIGAAAADYDDGVALVDYTQSEVFETETFCNDTFTNIKTLSKNDAYSSDAETGKSDVDDTWQRKKINTAAVATTKVSPNESDKENSAVKTINNSKSAPQDEGDKEIERLINLNGLIKRPNLGTAKSAESNEKAKAKSTNSKNKDIIDTFTDDDIQAEIFSDPSLSESEEEIITEKQFLKRCNENVKQQLLSDSNSDTAESDITDDIEEILSSNEGSRSNSPLVDRFLKKFNANDSEDEDSEKCDNTNSSSMQQQQSDAYDLKIDKNKSISSDNSDCEMLDGSGGDMGITASTKHSSKTKSLEKMLSVVEKRKKMNRLCDSISLSSESESSDVEAVEEEKSSRIKPMLRPEQLATVTREAQRHESERIRRLEKKHKTLTKLLKERPDVQEDCNLILDYNEETKTFIKVHPDIVKHLKQHQREGVRFMYDSCYGGIEALKKSSGSGCILAHCMGLGKTLQLIALLHTVISYKELKTSKVLVLCPKSTVMNWADEIERWLGPLKPKYYTFNDTSDVNDKIQILKDWSASTPNAAGILLIGYEAFRTLVFYHSYKNRGIAQSRLDSIRNDVDKYLLTPGADLVVCDEGHIIKNSKSAISLAVSQIKTPKRIVLTGTPIQNNLKEYYSMVNFIKPLFLGTEKEFANLYANPIKNGQHKDSSKRDIQVMKQRSFVLHKKLSKFVQRKEAELLKTFLPQKYEYVLFIPMTKVQTILYEHILAIISKKDERGKGLITDYTCLRKIWTHPKVLEDAWINATAQKHRKDSRKQQAVHSDDDQPDDVYDSQTGVISVTNDWWRNLLSEKDLETILPSNKLRTMFEILRMCEEKGEKCLIFSAFVAVLNVVEYFFKKMNDKDPETLKELKMSQGYQVKNTWILGKDYYRLDGKTPKLIRHEMIEQFNSVANKRARVFLISSRAGGQGINLTGANRVIILDTSWNPSNDQQNIFRVFRLGQKKNCYIYRLIAMGTMEEKVYSRSVTKQAMSFRVVDIQQIDRHYSMAELTELYSLTNPDYENRPMPDCPQDSILACLLLNYPSLVYKYHEHDSLLENKVEQELSEQEKQDAWAAYERDQQINSEIREMPNPDELQNNLSAPKFPPYLGSSLSAFNQMSALFNYGNFPPASLSPYLPYLSHLNNYSASNQQYLEMRKRLSEGTFPYPDINTSLGQTPFSTPFGQNAPKPISTNPLIPDLPLHTNPLHTNPLSALGDLSMFGLGNAAAAAAANNHMQQQQQQQQQRQHSSPTYAATNATNAAAAAAAANFDYQMYENSLKSLMNYRHDFSAGSSNSMNKSSKGGSNNNIPSTVNQFKNPIYSAQMSNMTYDKNNLSPTLSSPTPPKSMEQQQQQAQKQQLAADKNAAGKSSASALDVSTRNDSNANVNKSSYGNMGNSSGARNSPLPTAQVGNNNNNKRTYLNDVNITNVTAAAAAANNVGEERFTTKQKTIKDTIPNYQSYNKSNTSAGHNSGGGAGGGSGNSSIYSNKNITASKTSNDNNKNNNNSNKSSMQIIPTTSPPGTTSITKQFTDISPSISLTAVTTTSNNSNSNNASNQANQKNLMKNTTNIMKTSTSSSSNKPELTKASTPYPTNKFFEMHKKSAVNRNVSSKTNLLPTNSKSLISTEPISKSVTRTRTPTPTPTTSSLSTTQNSYQQKKSNSNEIGSKLLSAVVTKASNNSSTSARNASNVLHKKPQNPNLTVQQIKSSNTNVRTTPTASATITAVKSQQNGLVKSTTLIKPTQQQNEFRKTPVSIEKKRASPIVTKAMQQSSSSSSASSSSGQAPKLPTSSSSSSSLSSGALKIQANSVNANKTSASASSKSTNENMLTYILETCINQKKFAIGAPTKSGGGTTVTRVQAQGKRKNPENIPKDAGSNEPKRAK